MYLAADDTDSEEDAYNQYKQWSEKQPARHSKPVTDEAGQTESEPIDVNIDTSTSDVKTQGAGTYRGGKY